jgi:cytidylate kinase
MKKKHIITISGRPGSGKSSTSRTVASKLGYEHFSSGDLLRTIGRERGMDIFQTNLTAEKEKELDHIVDQKLQEIGHSQENVVIDSRLAWHWIPSSFKVYLDLDLRVAALRILQGIDDFRLAHEDILTDPDEYAARLRHRLESETRRYKALYNVDPFDKNNYDLVIDTKVNGPEQVVEQIVKAYHKWLVH